MNFAFFASVVLLVVAAGLVVSDHDKLALAFLAYSALWLVAAYLERVIRQVLGDFIRKTP